MKWKTDINIVKNCKSITAGILIGFGVIINTVSINPVVGATLFSFGLITIIAMGLPLYTGKIGYLRKEDELWQILVSNLIGVICTISLYLIANPAFKGGLYDTSLIKFSKGYIQMLACAILCGMLIHFAVKSKSTIVAMMAVIVFISIGAEHCIADFPFLIANLSVANIIKFIL